MRDLIIITALAVIALGFNSIGEKTLAWVFIMIEWCWLFYFASKINNV